MSTIATTRAGEPIGGQSPDITITQKNGSFHIELAPYDPVTHNAELEIMIEHCVEDLIGPAGWRLYLYGTDEEPVRITLDDQGRIVATTPDSPDY